MAEQGRKRSLSAIHSYITRKISQQNQHQKETNPNGQRSTTSLNSRKIRRKSTISHVYNFVFQPSQQPSDNNDNNNNTNSNPIPTAKTTATSTVKKESVVQRCKTSTLETLNKKDAKEKRRLLKSIGRRKSASFSEYGILDDGDKADGVDKKRRTISRQRSQSETGNTLIRIMTTSPQVSVAICCNLLYLFFHFHYL